MNSASCVFKGKCFRGHSAAAFLLPQSSTEDSATQLTGPPAATPPGRAALPHAGPAPRRPCPSGPTDGSLPRAQPVAQGACAAPRSAGRLHIDGRESSRPGGRWTAAPGRSWVRLVVRTSGESSRGAEGWRLAAGRRVGERECEKRVFNFHPPPFQEEWFGQRGMRCRA